MFENREIEALPRKLYRAAAVRELDRLAIQEHGIPGFDLMCRAGRAAFATLRSQWPDAENIAVFCGAGNNGGDGFVVAAEAASQGINVILYMLAPEVRLRGDALTAFQLARDAGVAPTPWNGAISVRAEVIVDGLLGTGLSGEVRAVYAEVISSINASARPVLALDIPSGLCSDTGVVLGCAVRAQHTITFIGVKQGLLTGEGRACCGRLCFDDLGVPGEVLGALLPDCERLELADLSDLLPRRTRSAHKGRYGHVLVVGGDLGMGGAGILAARAAGRAGAGLVSLATRPEHVAGVLAQAPEVMVHGVNSGQDLEDLLPQPSVIVVGPGLGRQPWGEQMLQRCWRSGKPLVLDADALNLMAADCVAGGMPPSSVMTPHPGEASRLLGCTSAEIQRDRFAAVSALRQQFGAVAVLKGSGSLVDAGQGQIMLCPYGNPGMASGGMGDVLSGIIGALMAQGLESGVAAQAGVMLHASAADSAAREGERGLLASDLLPAIRRLVNRGGDADFCHSDAISGR